MMRSNVDDGLPHFGDGDGDGDDDDDVADVTYC